MNADIPGTVNAIWPCSGAHTNPFAIRLARAGPSEWIVFLSLLATMPVSLGASPSTDMAAMNSRSVRVARSHRARKNPLSSLARPNSTPVFATALDIGDVAAASDAVCPNCWMKYGYPPEAASTTSTASGSHSTELSNFPSDEKLITEETNFKVSDLTYSSNGRKLRFEKLLTDMKGKISAETGKEMEGDHFDATQNAKEKNRCVICGHIDTDPKGAPEYMWGPYYPVGAVQGKVTTAALAKDMKFWAHMGHPCGENFIAADFFAKHPEYNWQAKYLRDMPAYPWTLFEAKK